MDDTGPAVFYNMLSQIMFHATKDELGEPGSSSLLSTSILKNSFYRFISNEASPWWDDQNTKVVKETRQQIVDQAAASTLKLLEETCGKNSKEWLWSKIHTLTHKHPMGTVKPLDMIFNVGPLPVPGGMEVINNLSFDLNINGVFPVKIGPALRKVTDFSDIRNGITVSPTGQSGNVMSGHYDDQAQMFAMGEFRKMMMDRTEIEQKCKVLKLIPQL
jgi:penicillin amidase